MLFRFILFSVLLSITVAMAVSVIYVKQLCREQISILQKGAEEEKRYHSAWTQMQLEEESLSRPDYIEASAQRLGMLRPLPGSYEVLNLK